MIKLFSHNDLDGYSPVLLAWLTFGKTQVEFENCNYNNINKNVENFIDTADLTQYDYIFLTDISINEEVAKKLFNCGTEVWIIDHHETSFGLKKFNHTVIMEVDKNGQKICGTKLFYQFLIKHNLLKETQELTDYVELVNSYDTWLWAETNNIEAKNMNDLFNIFSKINFIETLHDKLTSRSSIKLVDNPTWQTLIVLEQQRIKNYYLTKLSGLQIFQWRNYKVGVLICDQYISEIGNLIVKDRPEIDFVVLFNGISMSLRTCKDINVATIAQEFGGGGHQPSAGIPYRKDFIKEIAKLVFKE